MSPHASARGSIDRSHRDSLSSINSDAYSSADDLRRGSVSSVNVEGAISAVCASNEKPVAHGNGVSVCILLAEPVSFLQGYDANDPTSHSTSMLRGTLLLRITKQAKIKSVSLNFKGRSQTDWPEGIPPRRVEFKDITSIMNHTWSFFNAQTPQAEHSYGADVVQKRNHGDKDGPISVVKRAGSPIGSLRNSRDAKLSLSANRSRSAGKGENPSGGPTVAQRGYKVFFPGDYIYNFELPLDSRLPESINVDLGFVKYELEALVERSGAFRPNLVGIKEIDMVRAPVEGSLEQVEPIAISRNWEDQLHYDIVISGKSFPMGTSVPIAFKLTPLAKVQCHRIKVFVTENIQYFTSNKKVHRLEPTRKILLFEKRSDGPSISSYPGSSVRVISGGGIPYDYREAAANGQEDVPHDESNLLGNLENDSGSIGPTEMEFNVQLPSCHQMKDRMRAERLHFDTTYTNIQVNHWIKIVMRLSKPDETDGTKRRHFEISIDSPFMILSCRATQNNMSLPAYEFGEGRNGASDEFECGCPGATSHHRANTPPAATVAQALAVAPDSPSQEPSVPASRSWSNDSGGLARPSQAHVADDPNSGAARPIHLLRNPSFNPPPFSAEEPPPPLMTPPPNYDNITPGMAHDPMADYFARLAEEVGDDDERNDHSRMDMPLTPGGRVNRSMDIPRNWLPLEGALGISLQPSGLRESTSVAH